MNRLTAGFYQKAGTESSKEYFEKMEYDLNGNITRLKRSEGILQNGIALQVDNLKYDYTGNRLMKISDEQQNPSGYPYFPTPNGMEYDNNQINGNGNMTKHLDKGISSIQYNYLNLPKQITQNAQVTNYVYRADGTKVKKLFGDIETNYLDGFQYKSTKPSEAGSGSGPIFIDPYEVAVMKLRIIPTAEGYFDALNNQYIYNYTDHLGNVRLSYSDTNKDGIIQPRQYQTLICNNSPAGNLCYQGWRPGEIVETNNYYPFGLMHNYTATTQNAYQYKYNGKELQESGNLDYGWRQYMPDLGRWFNVDPLSEKSRRLSTYTYALNNPIMFIDPDGREAGFSAAQQAFINYRNSMPPDDYIDKTNGKYLGSDGANTDNIRSIDRRDFANVQTSNNGTTSSEATKQLQSLSNAVVINDSQIQYELQAVSDLSRKVEHQTFIVYNRQDFSVSAIRGEPGISGKVTVPETKSYTYTNVIVDNIINLNGKNYILLAQAHGHNLTTETGKTNAPGTSSDYDKPTAINKAINVYAIDAYNTKVGGQANIHRVTAGGIQTNFIGKTIGAERNGTKTVNIGLESLKSWSKRK